MTKEFLESKEITGGLIEMCRKRMPESVSLESVRPAESLLGSLDMTIYIVGANMLSRIIPAAKDVIAGLATVHTPVSCQSVDHKRRQRNITIGAILALRNVDPHTGSVDVFVAKIADFTDAKSANR